MNQSKSAAKSKISPARIAAFEILSKIESEKSFSSILLPIYEENLDHKDRSLCHVVTLGVLRHKLFLDRIIEQLTEKKCEKFDNSVLIALEMGIFQLLLLDKIPAHAAINESVNLVHRAKKRSAANLVNAVLRRVTREEIKINYADELEKISIETSHPSWLIERWTKQFGLEEAGKIAAANNETPELVFRLTRKSDDQTIETLKKLGIEIVESEIVSGAWKVLRSSEMLQLFAADGKIYFQEEASQMVARSVNLKVEDKFLDVCAAPGSKISLIANSNSANKNLLIAGDFYEHRTRFLRENCRRQNAGQVKILRYDAEESLPFAENSFDAVLVDAPCSGSGTIRRNPEIRYFLQPEDFNSLADKQLQILENASKIVKSGGALIYSTCSLEREENEQVCEKFLNAQIDFTKVSPNVAERFLTGENYARTFPSRDGTDGFFIARFQKN